MKYWFITLALLLISYSAYSQGTEIQKLPSTVSDPAQSEVLPVITADGKHLFFTRARLGYDGSTVFDIWHSKVLSDGTFSEAEVLGGNLSSRFGIMVVSVSPDNNTMYLNGKLQLVTEAADRIMVTHRTKTGWSNPVSIHINGLNASAASVSGGFLSADFAFGNDQRTVIIAIQSDSSMGGKDLFASFLDDKTNSWSVPLWLGNSINSQNEEMTPYLAADNKTLYFSSDRPGGIGQLDVYRSTRLDSTWRHWSTPENVGATINRWGRTSYYTEDAQGKYAYFVWRANATSQTDIYRAPAPKRENNITLFAGKVLDENGNPLEATIRYDRLSDGKHLGVAHSDPVTGEYHITLPSGVSYSLYSEKSGYLPSAESFDAQSIKAFTTVERNLILTKIKENAAIRLNNIFFETDKIELLPASFAELDRLANILLRDSSLSVTIEGHTDNTGSEPHNKALSFGRAKSVMDYMNSKGINPKRLQAHGFAAEIPIASNDTDEGKAKNRRVEFRIGIKNN
ncbi:MAG: OmpA family protein [bacterium]